MNHGGYNEINLRKFLTIFTVKFCSFMLLDVRIQSPNTPGGVRGYRSWVANYNTSVVPL
jgi:hypothetical protein